jgi:hypothetical protein
LIREQRPGHQQRSHKANDDRQRCRHTGVRERKREAGPGDERNHRADRRRDRERGAPWAASRPDVDQVCDRLLPPWRREVLRPVRDEAAVVGTNSVDRPQRTDILDADLDEAEEAEDGEQDRDGQRRVRHRHDGVGRTGEEPESEHCPGEGGEEQGRSRAPFRNARRP